MSETNMLEIERNIKSKVFKEYMKTNNVAYPLCLITINGYFLVLNPIFTQMLISSSVVLMCLKSLNLGFNSYLSTNDELTQEVSAKLRGTETYQKMEKEYTTFIANVADFIRSFKLNSSTETLLFLERMLNRGYLSANGIHEFANFRYSKNYLPEFAGARVISGKCLPTEDCIFISDILSTLGYKAEALYVKISKTFNGLEESIGSGKVVPNYITLSVTEANGKYLYNPIENIFFANPKNDEIPKNIVYPYTYTILSSVSVKDSHQGFAMFEHNGEWPNFDPIIATIPSQDLSFEKLTREHNEMALLYEESYPLVNEFLSDNHTYMENIDSLQKVLQPRSNKRIKEWLVP